MDVGFFEATTPHKNVSLKVKVRRRTYEWFKTLDRSGLKRIWPCAEAGYSLGELDKILETMQRFFAQENVLKTETDGAFVIVTEIYKSPKSGYPGRLYSGSGCQSLVRAIRSNILEETADLDMNNAMPRCVVWVSSQFKIHCPQFAHYVENRDVVLQSIAEEANVSKVKAKQLLIMSLTTSTFLKTRSGQLRKLDYEAKEIQKQLMCRPELQWILPFCKDQENKPGSFMALFYNFIECKLLMRVSTMLVDQLGIDVSTFIFDGLNIADKTKHGNQEILDRASAACEEIAPGINMVWCWKDPDFTLLSKDKKPLTDEDGTVRELRIPSSYQPPPPQLAAPRTCAILDPEIEPTYEELRAEFSLNLGGMHGKVGSEYIRVDAGKVEIIDENHLRQRYRELVYFEIKDIVENGVTKTVKEKHKFIDRWMSDERMNVRYIRNKQERYCWDAFDMYPEISKCPENIYNLWNGFAAETMVTDIENSDVRDGLVRFLEHFKMLCSDKKEPYDFMLDIIAHALQHPNVKLGIMLCLVGKQGCGKERIWNLIVRMIGEHASFQTMKPENDVFGDNNGRMRDAFFVRVAEAENKKFKSYVGELRTLITDCVIRVRSLYCAPMNVKSYARFFCDTNFRNALPDEHGERRLFITDCSSQRIGDAPYFQALVKSIDDDRCIRAFYDFLMARPIKRMYIGKDIPIGEYQKQLKDARRSTVEHFLEWLVESQALSVLTLSLTNEELFNAFKRWREDGGEFDRSKNSVLRELQLSAIEGVKLTKPRVDFQDQFGTSTTKQVKTYLFNLIKLRERYDVAQPAAAFYESSGTIDCFREVDEWIESIGFNARNLSRKRPMAYD